ANDGLSTDHQIAAPESIRRNPGSDIARTVSRGPGAHTDVDSGRDVAEREPAVGVRRGRRALHLGGYAQRVDDELLPTRLHNSGINARSGERVPEYADEQAG